MDFLTSNILQGIAAIAGIIGTIVAIFALVVSADFRAFVGRILSNRIFQISAFIFMIFAIGVYIGTKIELPSFFTPDEWPPQDGILDTVKTRGHLNCGINGGFPGFSVGESNSTGFDSDFCRVIAVAIFGDHQDRVRFIPLTASERLEAVENGTVDVLFRNTTWTLGRDLERNIEFGPTIFYDGQSFLVRKNAGINQLQDLDGKRICVLPNTTTIENLNIVLPNQGITFTAITQNQEGASFEGNSDVFGAYALGRCDAVTADLSQLTTRRMDLNDPGEHIILSNTVISKEPLSPAFIQGDEQWRDVVTYAVYATIHAAELGINSGNVISMAQSTDLSIREFLGAEDSRISEQIGQAIGIRNDFAFKIIARVGNYNEIYANNLSQFFSDPGLNQTWNQGGLLISPPFTSPNLLNTSSP